MRKKINRIRFFLIMAFALSLLSCVNPMSGASSLTFYTDRVDQVEGLYTPLGEISEKDCGYLFLSYFLIGKGQSHEGLVTRVLLQNEADILLNAEFKRTSITVPLFYYSNCVVVTGTVAKLK